MDKNTLKKIKEELLAEKKLIEDYLSDRAESDPKEAIDPTDTMDEKAQEVTIFEEDRAVKQSMELRLKKIIEKLNQIEAGTYE